MIKCNCSVCGIEIYRHSRDFNKNKTGKFFCSRIYKSKKINCFCSQCKKEFTKQVKELSPSGNNFCSQSCAAIFNNVIRSKPKNKCECGKIIGRKNKSCSQCFLNNLIHSCVGFSRTIQEHSSGKGSERYNKIRQSARSVYRNSGKPLNCVNCGYSKHVEICHITAIKNFPSDTLISTVNHIDNLACLCRNCHWELDHGMLDLSKSDKNYKPFPFCF